MSVSVQQILADAKRLAGRLKDHDSSADLLLSQAQAMFCQVDAMKEVHERFFDVEKGIFTTYQIRPEWLFANGKSGTAGISLRDANGKVLATTKVIVQ